MAGSTVFSPIAAETEFRHITSSYLINFLTKRLHLSEVMLKEFTLKNQRADHTRRYYNVNYLFVCTPFLNRVLTCFIGHLFGHFGPSL